MASTRAAALIFALPALMVALSCQSAPRTDQISVAERGAVGDGRTDDTGAIQRAIDECSTRGGGTVILSGRRTYLSGMLCLRSHVRLEIERGATLLASTDPARYGAERPGCLIAADGAEDVSIGGGGVIDGNGRAFIATVLPHIYRMRPFRVGIMKLTGCRRLVLSDITLRDSGFWAVHLAGCEDVEIRKVEIFNDVKMPNCDGIDPDHCRNVRIRDCHIEAGDDCIVIKNTRRHADFGPSENISVEHCVLRSTSAALKIGTESVSDFRNIRFDDCDISASGRGLVIQARDEGNIEDVTFSNMRIETRLFHDDWWGKAEPIHVTLLPRTAATKQGKLRNIIFRNIRARGENGVFISGWERGRPEGIVLENVKITVEKSTEWPGGRYDRRPSSVGGITEHRTAGIYCGQVKGLTLRDCGVRWGANRPEYFGVALEAHAVEGLKIEGFEGEAAHPDRDRPMVVDSEAERP